MSTGAPQSLAANQDGFSLVELLVAVLTGVIVTGALFAILEVSVRQTSLLTGRVQATQIGRTAMTAVVDELHSACIAREFTPVLSEGTGAAIESTPTKLVFVAGFSEKSLLEQKEVFKHEVYLSGGKLIDKSYAASGGTWPKFTFEKEPSPKGGVLLAENVSALPDPAEPTKTRVFGYYEYAKTANTGSTESSSSGLTPIPLKKEVALSATQANATSAVLVSFATAPVSNDKRLNRSAEFNNLITFAFGSPAAEATIVDGPCR
jgi:hypothetical protein